MSTRGRKIVFTPERLTQIQNLVERGMSREEIAATVECTVGSLQVTCSRLGISLRRKRIINGYRLAPRKPQPQPQPPAINGDKPITIDVEVELEDKVKNRHHTIKIPLTYDMMVNLALEAALRGMTMKNYIASLLTPKEQ